MKILKYPIEFIDEQQVLMPFAAEILTAQLQADKICIWAKVHEHNSKELIFGVLDSGYKLGTAENKSAGRSSTIQLFHGSEVAFWPNAAEHAKGIMQAIPDAFNTEAILESTANGVGNYFHQQWQKAEAGL